MIVKCEQCQTRFKIPDEKVSEKGVKVRCTKCQHTFRVKRDGSFSPVGLAPEAAVTQQVPAAPKPAEDPFAKFGAANETGLGEATRPAMYALGVEASRSAAGFDGPTRVGGAPSAPPGRKPLQDVPVPSGFDFAAALGAGEPQPPPPFDFAIAAPAPPPAEYQAPGASNFSRHGQDPFASLDLGSTDLTQPAAPTVTEPEAASVFGADSADFFASNDPLPVQQSIRPDELGLSEEGEVAADTSQRAALFDMPPPEPNRMPEGFNGQSHDPGVIPIARLKLVSMPVAGTAAAPDSVEPTRPRRKLGGLIFNFAIATVLVGLLTVILTVYLSEGKVELASFSFERLRATFASPTAWTAVDISNGLYDTRSGRPVFFVRGVVKNRTGKAARAKVRAEILDGNTAIRHADVWIGTAATPEDLYSIAVADDVDRLMGKLQKSAAEVMPGEKRGFLVPFFEYPPDLKGFRVRVTVIESGQPETAAR